MGIVPKDTAIISGQKIFVSQEMSRQGGIVNEPSNGIEHGIPETASRPRSEVPNIRPNGT